MEVATQERAPEATGLRSWRDNIEAALMAVVMALFLKYFVIEAFKIPSGSMQPTLIGDERAGIQDRILVDKLSYVLREPERWDVAVFRYPLDRSKTFVKRIAGVGPEDLRILDGDVWSRPPGGTWRVARRPAAVMSEHWKRLDELAPDQSRWIPQNLPGGSHWIAEGRSLHATGPGTAAFRGGHESIVDGYLDGYPENLLEYMPAHHRESGRNAVGDLRAGGRITARAGLERFTVVLREGTRRYRFELAGPAAPEGVPTRIDGSGAAVPAGAPAPTSAFRLTAGRAFSFAVENLDDRLALAVDGEELLALEIEPSDNQFSSVTLQIEGEGADLDDLMVWRDLYYTTDDIAPVSIPAGSYFMLGDNTQDSSDSREWTFSVWQTRADDGPGEVVRGAFRDRENPRAIGFGQPGGPTTVLVDEWGEKHWFAPDEAHQLPPERAPFVPRALIQGRALAVFWPFLPTRGIWRLEWVK